jgi:hypothetical protein
VISLGGNVHPQFFKIVCSGQEHEEIQKEVVRKAENFFSRLEDISLVDTSLEDTSLVDTSLVDTSLVDTSIVDKSLVLLVDTSLVLLVDTSLVEKSLVI